MFQLCVLPFGLCSAPFVFTKIFKALLKSWRGKGIPIVIFLELPTRVHVECVASIAGQIVSLSSCLGPVARVITRFLFSEINIAVSWDGWVLLIQDSISEIDFETQCPHPNWQSILGVKSLPVKIKISDASDSACDAFFQGCVPQTASLLEQERHLELCQARGTLIVPLWKSSFFWNYCSKESTGTTLLSTGCIFLSSRDFSLKGKRETPSLVPDN